MYFVRKNEKPAERVIPVVDVHNKDLFFIEHNGTLIAKNLCTSSLLTASYKFGKQIDLLATALPRPYKTLDSKIHLELVYFTVNGVLYCINVEDDDLIHNVPSPIDVNVTAIQHYTNNIHTTQLVPYLDEVSDVRELGYIGFSLSGTIDLNTGLTLFTGEPLVNNLSYAVKVELKGHTLKAFYAES